MLHFPVLRFSASITTLFAPWRNSRAGTSSKSKASPLFLTLRIRSPFRSTSTSVTGLAPGPKTPPSVVSAGADVRAAERPAGQEDRPLEPDRVLAGVALAAPDVTADLAPLLGAGPARQVLGHLVGAVPALARDQVQECLVVAAEVGQAAPVERRARLARVVAAAPVDLAGHRVERLGLAVADLPAGLDDLAGGAGRPLADQGGADLPDAAEAGVVLGDPAAQRWLELARPLRGVDQVADLGLPLAWPGRRERRSFPTPSATAAPPWRSSSVISGSVRASGGLTPTYACWRKSASSGFAVRACSRCRLRSPSQPSIGRSTRASPSGAARSSRSGRAQADAPTRILVVGQIHGDEPGGLKVIKALRGMRVPRGVALWTVRSVNPDGARLGIRQNVRGDRPEPQLPARLAAEPARKPLLRRPPPALAAGIARGREAHTEAAAARHDLVPPAVRVRGRGAEPRTGECGGATRGSRGCAPARLPRLSGHGHPLAEPPLPPIRRLRGRAARRPDLAATARRHARAVLALARWVRATSGVGSPGSWKDVGGSAPALREGEQVSPLELFFDLVFVLALTQCTQLMSDHPTWGGLVKGLLVLGLLWWAWVGYSWITSVVDPEDDSVRIVIFAAMAAMLLVALAVPSAFGGLALEFALAYAAVRYGQIGLFMIASREIPELRHSVAHARGQHHGWAWAILVGGLVPRQRRAGGRVGGRARARHGIGRTSSAARAGGSCRLTSPSGTG